MTDTKNTQGDLDISLNGRTATLKWKLPTMLKVSEAFGGMIPAHRAVMEFDIGAYAKIVAIGTERVLPDAFDEVQGEVFAEGMESLQAPLIRYLNRLVSGGKDPAPAEDLATMDATMATVSVL